MEPPRSRQWNSCSSLYSTEMGEGLSEDEPGTLLVDVTLPSGHTTQLEVEPNLSLLDLVTRVAYQERLVPVSGWLLCVPQDRHPGYALFPPSTSVRNLPSRALQLVRKDEVVERAKKLAPRQANQPFTRTERVSVEVSSGRRIVLRVDPETPAASLVQAAVEQAGLAPAQRLSLVPAAARGLPIPDQRPIADLGTRDFALLSTGDAPATDMPSSRRSSSSGGGLFGLFSKSKKKTSTSSVNLQNQRHTYYEETPNNHYAESVVPDFAPSESTHRRSAPQPPTEESFPIQPAQRQNPLFAAQPKKKRAAPAPPPEQLMSQATLEVKASAGRGSSASDSSGFHDSPALLSPQASPPQKEEEPAPPRRIGPWKKDPRKKAPLVPTVKADVHSVPQSQPLAVETDLDESSDEREGQASGCEGRSGVEAAAETSVSPPIEMDLDEDLPSASASSASPVKSESPQPTQERFPPQPTNDAPTPPISPRPPITELEPPAPPAPPIVVEVVSAPPEPVVGPETPTVVETLPSPKTKDAPTSPMAYVMSTDVYMSDVSPNGDGDPTAMEKRRELITEFRSVVSPHTIAPVTDIDRSASPAAAVLRSAPPPTSTPSSVRSNFVVKDGPRRSSSRMSVDSFEADVRRESDGHQSDYLSAIRRQNQPPSRSASRASVAASTTSTARSSVDEDEDPETAAVWRKLERMFKEWETKSRRREEILAAGGTPPHHQTVDFQALQQSLLEQHMELKRLLGEQEARLSRRSSLGRRAHIASAIDSIRLERPKYAKRASLLEAQLGPRAAKPPLPPVDTYKAPTPPRAKEDKSWAESRNSLPQNTLQYNGHYTKVDLRTSPLAAEPAPGYRLSSYVAPPPPTRVSQPDPPPTSAPSWRAPAQQVERTVYLTRTESPPPASKYAPPRAQSPVTAKLNIPVQGRASLSTTAAEDWSSDVLRASRRPSGASEEEGKGRFQIPQLRRTSEFGSLRGRSPSPGRRAADYATYKAPPVPREERAPLPPVMRSRSPSPSPWAGTLKPTVVRSSIIATSNDSRAPDTRNGYTTILVRDPPANVAAPPPPPPDATALVAQMGQIKLKPASERRASASARRESSGDSRDDLLASIRGFGGSSGLRSSAA